MSDNKPENNGNPFANQNMAKDPIASEIVGKSCRYGESRLSSLVDDKYIVESSKLNGNASGLKFDKYRVVMCWHPKGQGKEEDANWRWAVYKTVAVLEPSEVCDESYLIVAAFDTRGEADNLCVYLKTKFVIFLVAYESLETKICKTSFIHVPLQDFSKPWTDAELYKKYELDRDEVDFIESNVTAIDEEVL